jgi:quercetin dioxygenase-like cupin family protein
MSYVVRRVVTGHDADGKSVVVEDGRPPRTFASPPGPDGISTSIVWASDGPMTVPHTSGDPTPHLDAFFPEAGGTRFFVITHPPGSGVTKMAVNEGGATADGMSVGGVSDAAMMHATDTVDYAIVVFGQMWLELSDGEEVLLNPGDCVVQNGTWHGWRNRGDVPCMVAFVVIGATKTA